MACTDHAHMFQSHDHSTDPNLDEIKLKDKKTDDTKRKQSNDHDESDKEEDGKTEYLGKIVPTFIGGTKSSNISAAEEEEEEEKLGGGWESVAGLQHVIDCMKEVVVLPLLYPELFNHLHITPPRGVLLHGYPGTGKTHVVRALVGSCARGDKRIAYFSRKGADCLGKYVGESEKHLKKLFEVAEECQPSIIFFDEIDGLAPSRMSTSRQQQDQTHISVVSTLLSLLDGLKSRGSVVVIGATNRPNSIDPALRRPGRFDREIYFPLPSLQDRISILSLYTQKWPKTLHHSNQLPLLQWIATQTSGFAGADLQALCTQTAIIALKRSFSLKPTTHLVSDLNVVVQERDWLEALSTSPPPCSRREASSITENGVASSPLPSHLIPCLIQPLSTLLVSLYMEEGICLPNTLSKAATIIKSVMISTLERKDMVSDKWWFYVDDFIQDNEIANEIERKWEEAAVAEHYDCFGNSDKFIPQHKDTSRTNHENSNKKSSFELGKTPGFRIMIAGNPRSGQRHLASCILNYFVQHLEIRKIDMASISRLGYNNLGQAIVRVLGNYLSYHLTCFSLPSLSYYNIG